MTRVRIQSRMTGEVPDLVDRRRFQFRMTRDIPIGSVKRNWKKKVMPSR